jgi:elongation factor Ts
MDISASVVKTLREKTGAGMMDCKKALQETEGDMDKAIEYLRKKGAATAEKRADRSANEGVVLTQIDGSKGTMIEVNCETDFVARSEDFLSFAQRALEGARSVAPATVDALLGLEVAGSTLASALTDAVGKLGEKIEIRRFANFNTEGVLVDYIHPGAKLGVMIEIAGGTGAPVAQLGKDLAMHIAAMNPVAIDRSAVPAEVQAGELDIYRQQAREMGKPENMIDRIAEGKLNKYFQEYTLLEQTYVRDSQKTVQQHVAAVGAELGMPLSIARFERFQIGG